MGLAWLLLAGCSNVVARTAPRAGEAVAQLPLAPGTEAAIRQWAIKHANPRDHSLQLEGAHPYAETALEPGSPVARVGFFFRKEPWRAAAILYWLRAAEPPPATSGAAGTLWGLPLARIDGSDAYSPDLHLVVKVLDATYALPAEPPHPPELPRRVPIKTPTATFHRDLLFTLHEGRIWFKRNPDHEGRPREPWRLFGDGLPSVRDGVTAFDRPRRIEAISADGDDLVAVDDRGRVYTCTTRSKSLTSVNGWDDGWGYPGKRPLFVAGRAKDARAVVIGRRAEHALYFEDAIGNRHHFGPMGTSTLYALDRTGSELLFTDNGLPNDFSRSLCGPDDARFIAENLSASASALFLIDRYGRMLTRFDDYDLNGGTPNFEYTYRSVIRPDDDGTGFMSSLTPYFLPLQPWRWHAPPPLTGKARLSLDITVLQTGTGNAARELRVAGVDENGLHGYWAKRIEDEQWRFVVELDHPVEGPRLLSPEDVARGAADWTATGGELSRSTLPRAQNQRGAWAGTMQVPAPDGATAKVTVEGVGVSMDWNPVCPPTRLTFDAGSARFEVLLHTVDLWTPMVRGFPGHDGTPLLLLGTLVLDDALLMDTRPVVRRVVQRLRPYHHATFAFLVSMEEDQVELRAIDEGPGVNHPLSFTLRRTAWNPPEALVALSQRSTETLRWMRHGDLDQLVEAPRLKVEEATAPVEALRTAIEENKAVRERLRAVVREHQEALEFLRQYQESMRAVFPVVPLGRLPLLPKLLAMQLTRGTAISGDAAGRWAAADARLTARIAAYEEALQRRGGTAPVTPSQPPR